MRSRTAAEALAALLDRSLKQIAEAASDARTFDRPTVAGVADVWDNNTFPLFRAMTAATGWGRERQARAALAWMAGLGPSRRAWMVEQAAAAGHALDPVLPPQTEEPVHSRDYEGRVMPVAVPVTARLVEELGNDYDLPRSEVRVLQIERTGTRLTGTLAVTVTRQYTEDAAPRLPAELWLHCEDVTAIRFDADDRFDVTLAAAPDGVVIHIGTQGELVTAEATVIPQDRDWHLSSAGRAADTVTPARRKEPREWPRVRWGAWRPLGAAQVAANLVFEAMLELRGVRFPTAGDVPIQALCQAFTGAGSAALAAGSHRGFRRRDTAFRTLVEDWIRAGGPDLAPWFAEHLPSAARRDTGARTRTWAESLAPRTPPRPAKVPGRGPATGFPPQAQLRLARYVTAPDRTHIPRDASAVVQLAVAPDGPGPWRRRILTVDNPSRFHLCTAAFEGPCRLHSAREADGLHSLTLNGDALTITTPQAPDCKAP